MRFKQVLLFLFLLLIPLLIGAYSPQAVSFSRNFFTSVAEPFLEASSRTQLWFRDQKNFLIEVLDARKENKRLVERIRELEQTVSEFKEEKQENSRLKKLLSFKESNPQKTVSAQVIARDISHWTHYVVINKGSQEGIKPEMAVVSGEGLIGKVVSVGPHSARVILLLDAESRVSALVQETRDIGLIEGSSEPFLKMTYLDLHAQIQIGQTVVSSGFGDIYPKGIPIGQIIQILEDRNGLSLTAVVKPNVLFSKLEEVLCLVPQKEKAS